MRICKWAIYWKIYHANDPFWKIYHENKDFLEHLSCKKEILDGKFPYTHENATQYGQMKHRLLDLWMRFRLSISNSVHTHISPNFSWDCSIKKLFQKGVNWYFFSKNVSFLEISFYAHFVTKVGCILSTLNSVSLVNDKSGSWTFLYDLY
jgi:hypothetical protein